MRMLSDGFALRLGSMGNRPVGHCPTGVRKSVRLPRTGPPAEHARGDPAVASHWIAGLIRLSGIEVEIHDRNTDDADWLLRRVDDEFHAASNTIARESWDVTEDCGAMPLLEPTSKEDA